MPEVFWDPLFIQTVVATPAQNPTLNITTTTGDLLIAQCSSDESSVYGTMSGWTHIENRQVAGNVCAAALFVKAASGGVESPTASFASGSSNRLQVYQIRGLEISVSSWVGSTSAFGTTHTFGSLDVSSGDPKAVVAVFTGHNTVGNLGFSSGTLTPTKLYPESGSHQRGLGMASSASVGTHTMTATWTTGRTSVGWLLSFEKKSRGETTGVSLSTSTPVYKPDKTTPESGAGETGGSFPPQGVSKSSRIWDARGQVWKKTPSATVTAPLKFRNPEHNGDGWQTWLGGLVTTDADLETTPWEAGENEQQRILVAAGVTSGTFTITFEGQTTDPITFSATDATMMANIQAALLALSNLAPGDFTIADIGNRHFEVTFTGTYAVSVVSMMTANSTGLTGGVVTINRETLGSVPAFNWHSFYGLTTSTPGFKCVGTEFVNCGDAIDFSGAVGGTPWEMHGVKISLAHDDAVQNDNHQAGFMYHCLVSSCHVFFSCQESVHDGTGNTVTIENCLVRVMAIGDAYKPWKYGEDQHGGFWKQWTPSLCPKLIVRNCIFRADQPAAYGGPSRPNGTVGTGGGLAAPDPTVVLEMDNVLLINSDTWGEGKVDTWEEVATGAGIKYGTTEHWDYHEGLWLAEQGPLGSTYTPDIDAEP